MAVAGAGCDPGGRCGPTEAVVAEVVDGDTIVLESGERVRYLMVDAPESTGGATDCYGAEAAQLNSDLALGQTVSLRYDAECEDRFGRLLAYVSASGGREINSLMVERGFACALYVAPNGTDRRDEFEALERRAELEGRGMWGACEEITCK